MVIKTIILLVLYLLQFYLTSLWGKEYFAKLNQQSGAGAVFFLPIGAGAMRKKQQEPESLWKKIRSPSRSRLKKSQELELEPEPLKNLPAPQPCINQKHTTQFCLVRHLQLLFVLLESVGVLYCSHRGLFKYKNLDNGLIQQK